MSVDDDGVRPRPALDGIPAYKPGRAPTAPPGVTPYKISSNEVPYPPLPGVMDAAAVAVGEMNLYPDMFATRLVERLAEHVGVSADEVVVGTGSSGVLSQICTAFCDDGDDVVYAWRSFEAYPIMVGLTGARSVQVPLADGGRHDLAAMAAAVGPRTALVLLCTPNNPTGTAIHADELETFLGAVPADVPVVLDEAYLEFNDDPAAPNCLEIYRRHRNVIVLRTLSKAYGLAGLRVGYAVARPEVATSLRKCAVPFGVNAVAQAAALASLEAHDVLLERVGEVVKERDRVRQALADAGWAVPDPRGNFVWFDLGAWTGEFAAAAEARGLAVRPFDGEGVRATISVPEANDRLVEVAASFTRSL